VHLPWLPAERLIRAHLALPDAPFALVEKQRGALRLTAVSPAAHRLGMMPGLALADARARVPELAAHDADPQADQALLERLANACLRYTPRVMVAGDQALILDISGCHHFYDADMGQAETVLEKEIIAWLHAKGLTACCAFSPSADAALALAVHGLEEGSVGRLPVTALNCEPAVHHALRRAGLTRIGDLASRPRSIIASRFGEAVSYNLARLLGEVDTPIIPRRSQPPVKLEVRFAEPVGHLDSVKAAFAGLAHEAMTALRERGQGARKLTFSLSRCDGDIRTLSVETAAPSRDAGLIMRLFAERMESLSDSLDPGFGYDDLSLLVVAAEPLAADQHDFEARGNKAQEELAALLARLSTRLGPKRVTRWCHVDTHVPERAFMLSPSLSWAVGHPQSANGEDKGTRPLLLLNPPQRIDAIAEVPDGPPYRFRWRKEQHRVIRHEGPERIVMPWWDGRRKEARLTRDYYRVEDVKGRRFWLFRHGLYSETADPGWYLHGLFA
jgi:protein ImuB